MTQAGESRPVTGPRRRRGRPPASDGRRTAETILSAARAVFGELGFERTTLTEIAGRAGVTRPAVNHYFRSKQSLYEAVLASSHDAVTTAPVDDACGPTGVSRRLGNLVLATTGAGKGNRSYARFLTTAVLDAFRAPDVAGRAQVPLDEVRAFVRDTLAEGVRTGELRADLDVAAVTEMLIAVMWGMTLYAGFVGSGEQIVSVIEQFGRLLEGGLW